MAISRIGPLPDAESARKVYRGKPRVKHPIPL